MRQKQALELNGMSISGPGADEAVSSPFRYLHLGSLAYVLYVSSLFPRIHVAFYTLRYIGNAAVFDLGQTSFMGGLLAMYAWRSVYWSEQVSMRTRALLMIDWVVRCVLFVSFSWRCC